MPDRNWSQPLGAPVLKPKPGAMVPVDRAEVVGIMHRAKQVNQTVVTDLRGIRERFDGLAGSTALAAVQAEKQLDRLEARLLDYGENIERVVRALVPVRWYVRLWRWVRRR